MGIYFKSVISYKIIAEHFIALIDKTPCPSLLTLMGSSNSSPDLLRSSPNTPVEMYKSLANHLGLKFTLAEEALEEHASPVCYANSPELREGFELDIPKTTFMPIDVLDYVYAVFHSPIYREKYKEFMDEDFPQIPYPKDQKTFWDLVRLGSEIRTAHRLESSTSIHSATFLIDGSNIITHSIINDGWELNDLENKLGRIWINDEQYFERVPQVAWEFAVGSVQPAQKWLKDREGQTLSADDVLHYQKTIEALTETDRLMKAIGEIRIE